MANNLFSEKIKDSFGRLIQIDNAGNNGADGTLRKLADGDGTDLPIEVSTSTVNFTGNLNKNGSEFAPQISSGTLAEGTSANFGQVSPLGVFGAIVAKLADSLAKTINGAITFGGNVTVNGTDARIVGGTSAIPTPESVITRVRGDARYNAQILDFDFDSAPAGATGGSGTWQYTLPSNFQFLRVILVGGGGGGGSGRVSANDVAAGGGAGGSGGAIVIGDICTTGGEIATITVGAGGAGGAAVTTPDTNGVAGQPGGISTISLSPSASSVVFGFGASNVSSTGGAGGTTSAPLATQPPTLSASALRLGSQGSAAVAGSLSANASGGGNSATTGGGRAGGSISSANVAYLGGVSAGTHVIGFQGFLPRNFSKTGGGGNASIDSNATAANPSGTGAGGSGGGAARNGFESGAGAAGGDGFVRIICY